MPRMMKMSPSISRPRAFTLLELLVVITIIGILSGLMFTGAGSAMKRAKKSHAESTAYNLKNAISAYFTEYRKYPVQSSNNDESTPMRSDRELMDVLLGADSQKESGGLNPRGIAFYTDKAAKPAADGKYTKGVHLESDGGGELWDPYADYYYIRMDLDYNNRVEKPSWDDSNDAQVLPESIIVWSAGQDNEESTAGDNVKTW